MAGGHAGAAYRFRGAPVRDADQGGQPPGDGVEGGLADGVPLALREVRAFAGAAQRGDGVAAGVDQFADEAAQRGQVDVAGVRGEGVTG